MFVKRTISIPWFSQFTGDFYTNEFAIHCCIIAIFASLIAPFGGFFASGLKRGFKVKDFADVIPGHGGFTDRFDCQIIMSTFVFLYIREIIQGYSNTMTSVLSYFTLLSDSDQVKMYYIMRKRLITQGIILDGEN